MCMVLHLDFGLSEICQQVCHKHEPKLTGPGMTAVKRPATKLQSANKVASNC